VRLITDLSTLQASAIAKSKYSHYKPYVLIRTEENLKRAEKLLKQYGTMNVLRFLDEVQES